MSTTALIHNTNWGDVFDNINPFALASVGSALALTLCVIGAAWLVLGWCLGSRGRRNAGHVVVIPSEPWPSKLCNVAYLVHAGACTPLT